MIERASAEGIIREENQAVRDEGVRDTEANKLCYWVSNTAVKCGHQCLDPLECDTVEF